MTDTELRPKRGAKVSPLRDPEEYPPVEADPDPLITDPAQLAAMEAAEPGDTVVSDERVATALAGLLEHLTTVPEAKPDWRPPEDAFLRLQGGRPYLPARWRVVWLRRSAESHGWSIETELIKLESGTFKGVKTVGRQKVPDVENGMALFKAVVSDREGRIIGEGHAVEYSATFWDFIEKAETSAIARALAIAGFGTESAFDLDEGEIADSPLMGGKQPEDEMPVIADSSVEGVRQGGRQSGVSTAQLDTIRRLAAAKKVDADQLVIVTNLVLRDAMEDNQKEFIDDWDPSLDEVAKRTKIMGFLGDFTHEQAATIITALDEGG